MRASIWPIDRKLRSAYIFCVLLFCVAMAIVSPAQTFTKLHDFNGSDGVMPERLGLIQGADGELYGTTDAGGARNKGTIFKIGIDGAFTTLYSFSGTGDGQNPDSGLVQGTDGNFYGTTRSSTIYRITPGGTFTTLHTLTGNEGGGPRDALIQATDGNFYGTTNSGGLFGGGTIVKMTPSGTVTVLYSLCMLGPSCPEGSLIEAGLVEGRDGNFYGVATRGGTNGQGTVFKVTPAGTFTVLHNFDAGTTGTSPTGTLIQANDGNFYGTTYLNGVSGNGTIFKMTPGGTVTVLFNFCFQLDCSAGAQPQGGLIQASDGNFYGTTTAGANGHGVLFRMTPSGSVTSLHAFCPQGNCSDGNGPDGRLLQARDGNFYGTTKGGGTNADGTVFKLTGPALVSTTTTLTTVPNPSHLNQNVAMTATVHVQNGMTPFGYVFYYSDGVAIGIAMLNNSGVGVLNYSGLSMGTHSIIAVYQGLNGYAASTSNTVQQLVQMPLSTTTVTSTPNPSTFGQQVTITATVSPDGPPAPSGTVSFTSNGSAIAGCTNLPLMMTAICTTSDLAVGTDAIVATYSGDSNYAGSSGMVVQIVNPVPAPLQFVAVTPCRIVDTRNPNGPFGGPPIPGRTARSFPLTEADNPCGIPSSAVAYSLNVTVVPQTTLSYLTIWPTGEGQPTVSTLNAPDGRTKANAAIVPAGSPSGGVSVYVTQTTNVILDINGYFKPADSSTLQFYPVTPCRVADTRNANGPLGGPPLMGGVERDFPVLSSSCNLPQSALAYSLNFTALPLAGHLGFLTVWPQGLPRPTVSTLNDPTGTTVANASIVPAGTGGGVATYASQDTNLIIDVNGYFAAPGTGGLSLYVLTPCRVLDTRNGNGAFSGELTVHVMSSFCEVAGTAKAYVFNATVIPVTHLGFLTLWPDGQEQPVASTLNAPDGAITSNMAIVPTTNGSIDAYASQPTQLILDISSYFAP